MEKPGLTRNQIHIISRHSNLPEQAISRYFKQEGIYAGKGNWARFIDIALLSLAVAFCLAGVVFFFAYNWADLHKFVKLGIVQGLLAAAVIVSLLPKLPALVKNLLLTVASILTGVLFAVFGQIYQTGANTYDLFLGWTIFITLWALVANFAALWLIWLALVNITLLLYTQQVARHWDDNYFFLTITLVNVAAILITQILHHTGKLKKLPTWFNNIVALGAIGWLTIGVCNGIFSDAKFSFGPLLLVAVIIYGGAVYYSLQQRQLFYLCIIPLSVIIILTSLITEHFKLQSGGAFLLVSVFIIVSISLTVSQLLKLKKHWDGTK